MPVRYGGNMELRHLKYFIAVAEEENVTRAAARLHVAQPALSRQIRDLEHELGVELFDHAVHAIRLNAAGRHFLEEAREAVARFEQAVRSVRAFSNALDGELHLGYAPSLTTKILPKALREFQDACPRMRVMLHDLSTEEMLAGLRGKQLHAALLVKPSNPALDGLLYDEIARFRPCVALSLSHPLAADEVLTAQSLAGERLIAYSQSDYPEHRAWLGQVFKGTNLPCIAVECDSSSSLIAAVELGDGVAVVQEGFETLVNGRLAVRVLKAADDACFSFGVARRKDDSSETTRTFIKSVLTAPTVPEDNKPIQRRTKRR